VHAVIDASGLLAFGDVEGWDMEEAGRDHGPSGPRSLAAVAFPGAGGGLALEVLSYAEVLPSDPRLRAEQGVSLSSLPISVSPALEWDVFHASRQVDMGPAFDGGFSAVVFEHPFPSVGRILVAYGRNDASRGAVSHVWRRSD